MKLHRIRFSLLIIITIIFSSSANANDPLKPLLIDEPPVIDGVLDENLWSNVPYVTGFKTFIPDFSNDMKEKTVVYMAYDKENLYYAYKCYDSEPDKIKASVTNRDNIRAEDWICINLDSFNDQQSLYAFYVNPLGIQADSRFAGGTEDTGIDFVWYSAGKIDDDGYTVEIQIPLKSIRYSNGNPVEMAVFFERKISRYSEQGSYPALDPELGYAFLTQLKPIFYYDIEHYTLLEVLPAVTYGEKYLHQDGKMTIDNRTRDLSLTMKYGITSDLIFDGTYNPDFSQVEADAGQVDVNLRYGLFFPEKRSFFLEGRENFWIAGTSSSEIDPVRSILHTRTIANPLIGTKLSGKIGTNNTISVIYALDELMDNSNGEDYAHVPFIRYKRSLPGDSFIGGIAASREFKASANRIGGIDGQIRITEASMLEAHALFSQTKIDSVGLSTNGHSFGLKYSGGSRDFDFEITARDISKDFQVDMGYVRRNGLLIGTALLRPKFYPSWKFIQRIDGELLLTTSKDKFFDMWETYNFVSFHAYMGGRYELIGKYSYSTEIYLGEWFKTGGFHVYAGGQFTNNFFFGLLYRNIDAIYYDANPFQGHSNRLTINTIYEPSDQFHAEADFVFYDLYRKSDDQKIYDYPLARLKLTYQLNKYLFFRGIVEYNEFKKQLITDLLVSFTYIPGTVIFLGYGSLYDKVDWREDTYVNSRNFMETRRGFFFKASYLWRL
ncbi:DUF5916 domain-containing protein [Bacteroidota bacterium]